MSNPEFPPAVVIGLWLNAAQSASVTKTDAANALETITGQIEVFEQNESTDSVTGSWLDLVSKVSQETIPVAVALPVEGDPSGIPGSLLAKADREFGVVAINRNLLLFKKLNANWVLASTEHTVMHYDLGQTRRSLNEQIATSSAQLAASNLVGDENEIKKYLEEFRSLHLPPNLSKRSTDALESAAKVLIVAKAAISSTTAVHSPSIDRLRLHNLEQLILKSRTVLQSVVTG